MISKIHQVQNQKAILEELSSASKAIAKIQLGTGCRIESLIKTKNSTK